MRPPLHEQPDSAILARVAIRVAMRKWREMGSPSENAAETIYLSSASLPKDGFGQLRFALHSLAAHNSAGIDARQWLEGVVFRASQGGVFRWHFFAGYKGNRNPYPRVTNRGVQTSRRLITHNQKGDILSD